MTLSTDKPLPRREVAIIVLYDDEKRMLLQKRTMDAPTFPGVWGFFGGGIEKGESPLDALKREVYEELEYEVSEPEFVFDQEYRHEDPPRELKRFVFIEKYDPSRKLVLHEGERMGWFTHEETLGIDSIPHFNRPVLKKIHEKISEKLI